MPEFGSFEHLRDTLRVTLAREDGLVHVRCDQCRADRHPSGPFLRTDGVTAAILRELVEAHVADHGRDLLGLPPRYRHETRP